MSDSILDPEQKDLVDTIQLGLTDEFGYSIEPDLNDKEKDRIRRVTALQSHFDRKRKFDAIPPIEPIVSVQISNGLVNAPISLASIFSDLEEKKGDKEEVLSLDKDDLNNNIWLIHSDGKPEDSVEIDKVSANLSSVIKEIIETDKEAGKDKYNPIPLPNISKENLPKLIQFLVYVKNFGYKPSEKPCKSGDMAKLYELPRDQFFINFVDIEVSKKNHYGQELYDLIKMANFLGIESLLDLCVTKTATLMFEKKASQIREIFGVEPPTQAESKQIAERIKNAKADKTLTPAEWEADHLQQIEDAKMDNNEAEEEEEVKSDEDDDELEDEAGEEVQAEERPEEEKRESNRNEYYFNPVQEPASD